MVKLSNLDTNRYTSSQMRDSHGLQQPLADDTNQSLEDSLLLEDFSSSEDDSSELDSFSRTLSQSILSYSKVTHESLTSTQREEKQIHFNNKLEEIIDKRAELMTELITQTLME